jgi:hypothetical protein
MTCGKESYIIKVEDLLIYKQELFEQGNDEFKYDAGASHR